MSEHRRATGLLFEAIVVIGSILLAFAIQAWWDGHTERRLEAEYTTSLRSEIRTALVETRQDLEGRVRLDSLLGAFLEHAPLSPDSVQVLLIESTRINNIAPPTAVLDDLISSGRLQIIRSTELREGLILFRQMMEKVELNEEPQRSFVFERLMPFLSSELPLSVLQGSGDPLSSSFPTALPNQLTALQQDRQFQNLMIERRRVLRRGLSRIQATVDHLEYLDTILGS